MLAFALPHVRPICNVLVAGGANWKFLWWWQVTKPTICPVFLVCGDPGWWGVVECHHLGLGVLPESSSCLSWPSFEILDLHPPPHHWHPHHPCNEPVFKSIGHCSSTPEHRTTCSTCSACSAVCFQFNQGTIDLCLLSVSPAHLLTSM